jgi:cardiolipin synthase
MSVNIPNILSLSRILLTPLFVICLLRGMFSAALLVFAAAGISDALDGLLARCFNQKTELGAYLDPIADKILLMSAFISLAVLKVIPGWLAVIVISRDIVIMAGFAVSEIININIEIRPSLVSKCTTVAQVVTVLFTLLNFESFIFIAAAIVEKILYWLTAGLTIISGLHYVYIGMNLLQNANHSSK